MAIHALMRILRDPSLSQHHNMVVQVCNRMKDIPSLDSSLSLHAMCLLHSTPPFRFL